MEFAEDSDVRSGDSDEIGVNCMRTLDFSDESTVKKYLPFRQPIESCDCGFVNFVDLTYIRAETSASCCSAFFFFVVLW